MALVILTVAVGLDRKGGNFGRDSISGGWHNAIALQRTIHLALDRFVVAAFVAIGRRCASPLASCHRVGRLSELELTAREIWKEELLVV